VKNVALEVKIIFKKNIFNIMFLIILGII